MIKLAILTPTYNREELICRCYESLKKQSKKDFVWYVVDDGSADNTEKVINEFISKNRDEKLFKIVYIKKQNGGKHTALNEGLKHIGEKYVTILDSDDFYLENAVETILRDLPKIDDDDSICGIGYLKLDTDRKVIGKSYTKDGITESFVEQRYNKNTFGDKAEVFKTEILKKYPFPVFEGERFLSEATVWATMSGPYKMLFQNKGFYICDYRGGGLSDGVHKRLFNNPLGAKECYKVLSGKQFCFKLKVKYTIAYIIYALAAGFNLKEMEKDHFKNKFLITMLYLPALILFKRKQKIYSNQKVQK